MNVNRNLVSIVALMSAGVSASLITHRGMLVPIDALAQGVFAIALFYGLQYLYSRQGLAVQTDLILAMLCITYPVGALCARVFGPVLGMIVGMIVGFIIGQLIVIWWQQDR